MSSFGTNLNKIILFLLVFLIGCIPFQPEDKASKKKVGKATNQIVYVVENSFVEITLGASNVSSKNLTFEIVSHPSHGVLTGTLPDITYTPDPSYVGSDSFTFRVNNLSSATVSITVTPIANNPPNEPSISCDLLPLAQSLLNDCTITAASPEDDDGDFVTYYDSDSTCEDVIVNSLTGDVTYTAPLKGETCQVKVVAFDDEDFSEVVSSSVITGQNNAPTVPQIISCPTSVIAESTGNTCSVTPAFILDIDGDNITYLNSGSTCLAVVVNEPSGAVSFTAPEKGITCEIRIVVYDEDDYSSVITSTILGANNPPNVPDNLDCGEINPVAGSVGNNCTLTAASTEDIDGDSVSYADSASSCDDVIVNPATGNLTYTAPANRDDTCVISVVAYDNEDYSPIISATINGGNQAPLPSAQTVGVTYDVAKAITLSGTDADGDSLTYEVMTSPTNGVLTGTVPNLTYTPNNNYFGSDSFTFRVYDGYSVSSSSATISINVSRIPVANPQSVNVVFNTPEAISLSGSDMDGDSLSYEVVTDPSNGSLTGTAPNLTYTPTNNFFGVDSFTFRVYDGVTYSPAETVSISVSGTVYFCPDTNPTIDYLWDTVENWYKETGCTNLLGRTPIEADSVYIEANSFIDQPTAITLSSLIGNLSTNGSNESLNINISANGTLHISSGNWFGSSEVGVDAEFSGASANVNMISGDAVFLGSSENYGDILGNATFNGSSSNAMPGIISGSAIFNDTSSNFGTVGLSVTCNTTGTCTPVP